VLEGAALSRPDVTFTLERDGRKIRELLRVASRRDRVTQLFPDESLAEVTGDRGPVCMEAYLSRPERGRPGTAGLWLLVNARVIRDRMLAATVAQAYGSSLSSGNYPRGVLYLDIPHELVDVNVHPQKTEVRFVDPRALSDAVYSIVSRCLSAAFALPAGNRGSRYQHRSDKPPVNALPIEQPLAIQPTRAAGTVKPAPWALGIAHQPPLKQSAAKRLDVAKAEATSVAPTHPPTADLRVGATAPLAWPDAAHTVEWTRVTPSSLPPPPSEVAPTEPDATDAFDEPMPDTMLAAALDPLLGSLVAPQESERNLEPSTPSRHSPKNFGQLRFLAQVRLTFLVCEGQDGLYIIDQHAAAERVAFSKLLAQYRARSLAAQALLFPVMVDVLPKEVEVVEQQLDTFKALGLDVRVRGTDRVSVHSTPRLLSRASPERLVRDLLTEMTRQGGRGFSSAIEQSIALMACHGSLRAGEALTAQQAQALLASLDEVDMSAHCTHGRPVVAVTRFHDLERQVGRR
jgi:DNA mismatch repair protein MutL